MSRRSEIVMTDAEIAEFLAPARVMTLATIGPTGAPHLTAMWYVVVGGKLRFWTYRRSQKAVNLRRDQRLTCMVADGDEYATLRGVVLYGRGRLLDDPAEVAEVGLLEYGRYVAPGHPVEEARPMIEAQAAKRVAVEVEVERVVSWDHRKLGGGR